MMSLGRELREGLAGPRCGLAILGVGALYSGLDQYGEAVLGGPKPLHYILALVAGSLGLLAAEPFRPSRALRSPLLLWAFFYLLMSTAWCIWRQAYSPETDQALVDRYRSVALLVAMAFVFDDERARAVGRWGVVLVAVASSLVNIGEAVGAVTFEDDLVRTAGRAAGLYANPNGAGLAIVLGLAAGLLALPRALRLPVLVICACGVAATFSRGALACLSVLVVVLLIQKELGRGPTIAATVGVVALIYLEGRLLQDVLEVSGALNRDTLARLSMTADDSGRGVAAAEAWMAFVQSPWVGYGVATVRESQVAHNMYLSLATEHGVLGLLTYPALLVALSVRNRPALGLAAVCAVAALTAHTLLAAEPALVCVALGASRPLDAGLRDHRRPAAPGESPSHGSKAPAARPVHPSASTSPG